ncbi:MAG: C25 family cysteine peptidase [Bacteriovoracaceae bacterium]
MKKEMLPGLLGLALLANTTYGSVSMNETATVKTYQLSAEGIELKNKIIEGQAFQVANLVGVDGFTGVRHDVGAPEIPVIRFFVEAKKASDIKVDVHAMKTDAIFALSHELKPAMESVEKVSGATYKIERNLNYKTTDVDFEIAPSGSVRGHKQFMVTLYPVEYVGANNTLKISRTFSVSVKKIKDNKSDFALEGMVFVVASKFKNSPSLSQYMELKKAQGFEVSRIDLANGVNADQIRAKIKSLYSTRSNLKYAVIVGDAADAPGRTSTNIEGLTDHYFSAIDTNNYDTDINGPDISVGRFSVASEAQLATVLKKYTRYIKGDFSSMSWTGNLSFLATDDRYEVAEGTHNYVVDSYTKNLGYLGTFPEVSQKGGDKLYAITYNASTPEVMKSIAQGRSIIDYSGHGANTFWDAPKVTQSDVRSLGTNSSLPFVISNSCITGDYRVDESFAETWQRHEWGAVMFWGSMDSTYWDEDDILERRMFDGIFKGSLKTFGDITKNAMMELWKQYGGQERSTYYWETYHMFGDPSITLRLK